MSFSTLAYPSEMYSLRIPCLPSWFSRTQQLQTAEKNRSIKNRCGSLTIDVQRMPLNGVKMETPFQKWFKPPPSGKHSSPEIHFQGNSSSNGSMCHCYAGTTKRHVDTCGDIPKPCQLPSIATS